jgi:hypothetical protein
MVGPDTLTWNQYFQKFNAALGLPAMRSIPRQKARLRALLMSALWISIKLAKTHLKIQPKKLVQKNPLIKNMLKPVEKKAKLSASPAEFNLYSRKAVYPSNKAKELLGFQPKFDIDAGLKLTAAWLYLSGLTKR